jgi:hypothetical protein
LSKKNSKKNREDIDFVEPPLQVENEEVFVRPRRGMNYPINPPIPMNMDDIAIMSDEEVFARAGSLENDRAKIADYRLDPTPWEVEIAYYRREQGIRRARREIHEAFVKENAEFYASLDAESAGDFHP